MCVCVCSCVCRHLKRFLSLSISLLTARVYTPERHPHLSALHVTLVHVVQPLLQILLRCQRGGLRQQLCRVRAPPSRDISYLTMWMHTHNTRKHKHTYSCIHACMHASIHPSIHPSTDTSGHRYIHLCNVGDFKSAGSEMERPCAHGGPSPRLSSRAIARDRRRCSSSSCFARCLSTGQASPSALCTPPSSPELCAVSARKRSLIKKRGTVVGVSVSSTVESGDPLLTTLRSGDSDFLRCIAGADKRSLMGLQLPSFRLISRWGSDALRVNNNAMDTERVTGCRAPVPAPSGSQPKTITLGLSMYKNLW